MINCLISSSPLAAPIVSSVCVPGLFRLVKHASPVLHRTFHARPSITDTPPFSAVLDPLNGHSANVAPDLQNSSVNRELLRYSTHFPDALYSRLAGLMQSRPFPTAVDMSCAMTGIAGAELGRRGFRVAQSCPPVAGSPPCGPRLPGGVCDMVTLLPGPRDLHAPELLAEARRLMADGAYLAVAWNDRDLSSPFVAGLEALLEGLNPAYCRTSRQHNPPAVLGALCAGGSLVLDSFTPYSHSLALATVHVLQDLLGGFAVVRPHLAASSTHRKAFHQEVRALVRRHFGEEDAPFELPLVSKLYVLRQAQRPRASMSSSATAGLTARDNSSTAAATSSSSAAAYSSSSSSDSAAAVEPCDACGEEGCLTHHVRTRRSGLMSRDSCNLRHLYAY